VNAAALIEECERRGARLQLVGEQVYLHPAEAVPPELLATLRARKYELAQELARRRGPAAASEVAQAIAEAPIHETRERLGAALIRSPRYGELWLVLDPCALPDLEAEEAARAEPRPVLLAEDVVRLRGKSEAAIRAALDVARVFPGSRVLS
jgi:hypothetical protein